MADYDLGKAHGKITLDYDDKGAQKALKSFQSIQKSADKLGKGLKGLTKITSKTTGVVKDFGSALDSTEGAISGFASKVQSADKVLGLLGQKASLTSRVLDRFALDSIAGFDALGVAIKGVPKEMENFPTVIKRVVRLTATISTATLAVNVLGRSMGLLTAKSATAAKGFGMISKAGTVMRTTLLGGFAAISGKFFDLQSTITQGGKKVADVLSQFGPIGQRAAAMVSAGTGKMNSGFNSVSNSAGKAKKSLDSVKTAGAGVATAGNGIYKGLMAVSLGAFAVMNGIKALKGFAAFAKIAALGAAGFGLSLTALAGVASVVGVSISWLWKALKQLSGAFLILPGVVSAAVFALSTLMVGLKGTGSAFSAAIKGEEGWEDALKDLSGNAKEVAYALHDIAPAWKEVQQSVQDKMFWNLGNQLSELSDLYLPGVQAGMERVGDSFNTVMNNFAEFAKQPRTVESVNEGFELTGQIIDKLAAAVIPFMEGLREVGIIGLRVFNDMFTGVDKTAHRFSDFANSVEGQAKIEAWIRNGIQAFKDLWAICVNILKPFHELGEAMGGTFGGDALGSLRIWTEKFAEFFGEAEDGESRISKIADYLKETSAPWLDTLKTAFDALLPVLEKLSPFMQDLTKAVAGELGVAFKILGPILEAFATALSALSPVLVPLIASVLLFGGAMKGLMIARVVFGPVVAGFQAIAGAAGAVKAGTGALKAFRGGLAGVEAAADATPSKAGKMGAALRSAGEAASAAGGKVASGARTMGSKIADAAVAVGDSAKKIGSKVADIGKKAGAAAASTAKGTAKMIAQWAKAAVQIAIRAAVIAAQWLVAVWPVALVIAIVAGLVFLIIKYWDEIKEFTIKAWNVIKDSVVNAWNWIVDQAKAIWGNIAEFFSTLWEGIKSAFSNGVNAVRDAWNGFWDGLFSKVGEWWASFTEWLSTTWENIKLFFVNGVLAVVETWNNFWDGLFTKVGEWWTAFVEWLSTTWENIKLFFVNGVLAVVETWNSFWDSLFTKVGEWWASFTEWLSGIWESIKTTFSNGVENVKTTFSNGWNAVLEWTRSIWGNITGFISEKWTQIKTNVSESLENVKSTISNGWQRAKEFVSEKVEGMKQAVSNGFERIRGLASELPGKVLSGLGNLGTYLYNSGQSIIRGFWEGMKSWFDWVKDQVSGWLGSIRDLFPFSPAKEGPFSGRGWVLYSGMSIPPAFAKGIAKKAPVAVQAAYDMVDQVQKALSENSPAVNSAATAGQNMMNNVASGITSKKSTISAAFEEVMKSAAGSDWGYGGLEALAPGQGKNIANAARSAGKFLESKGLMTDQVRGYLKSDAPVKALNGAVNNMVSWMNSGPVLALVNSLPGVLDLAKRYLSGYLGERKPVTSVPGGVNGKDTDPNAPFRDLYITTQKDNANDVIDEAMFAVRRTGR